MNRASANESTWHRHKGAILGFSAALLILLFAWQGAPRCIDKASASAVACLKTDGANGPGSSLKCVGHARYWLFPVKLVPGLRPEAIRTDFSIQNADLRRRMLLAITADPDLKTFRAAANQLLTLLKDPDYPLPPPFGKVFDAIPAVDAETTFAFAEFERDGRELDDALWAALWLGDFDRAKELALIEDVDLDRGSLYDLQRGAFLCLVGEREAGLERLYRETVVHPESASQALTLCGGHLEKKSELGEPTWRAQLLLNPTPDEAWKHMNPTAPFEERARDDIAPFFAVWLAQGEHGSRDIVVQANSLAQQRRERTDWPSGFGNPMYVNEPFFPIEPDQAALEAAAVKLSKLVSDIESAKASPPSAAQLHADPNALKEQFGALPALREATEALRLEEEEACASRYDVACEERLIPEIPIDSTKKNALTFASDLARGGDRLKAGELYQQATQSSDVNIQRNAWLGLSMLDLDESEKAAALDAALEAEKLIRDKSGPLFVPVSNPPDEEGQVGWVLTAAALANGVASIPRGIPTRFYKDPDKYPRVPDDSLPGDWLATALADAQVRRVARWKTGSISGVGPVLPAVIYVLHAVADGTQNPDLWVNRMIRRRGPTGLRARAEAALWRGDTESAAQWNERAAKLEGLFSDPTRSALAHLATFD